MTYPLKFREQVLKIQKQEGLSYRQTAARFGIGVMSLLRWHSRIEPIAKRNKPAVKLDMAALVKDIEIYPDAYHRERAARLGVSSHGIYAALKRLRVTYKKNRCTIRRQTLLPEKHLRKR